MTNCEEMEEKYHSLMFGLRRSIRYNSRRQSFYESCNSFILFIAVVFSSAIAMSIVFDWFGTGMGLILSFVVTFATAIGLVFWLSEKASLHADFLRQFTELEIKLRRGESNPTEELMQSVTDERMLIEIKEPRVMKVLDTIVHNN